VNIVYNEGFVFGRTWSHHMHGTYSYKWSWCV